MRGRAMRTDTEILAEYLASGSEPAFAELVARHGPMVYRTCLRRLGDRHEAEDAAQATFMVLLRRAGAYRREKDLGVWLHGIARRVAAEAWRARSRRTRRQEEAAMVREAQRAGGEAAAGSPARPALDAELAGLPAAQRQAVMLRYLEGRSEAEAAELAGVPQGTLSQRASRGLAGTARRPAGDGRPGGRRARAAGPPGSQPDGDHHRVGRRGGGDAPVGEVRGLRPRAQRRAARRTGAPIGTSA